MVLPYNHANPVTRAEDLNGDYFVPGGAGEVEEERLAARVYFPATFVGAPDNAVGRRLQVTGAAADDFIAYNYVALLRRGVAPAAAARIVYLRLLGALSGVISPQFNRAAHHVRYNDAHAVADLAALNNIIGAPALADDNALYQAAFDGANAWNVVLPVAARNVLMGQFTDMCCAVAYIFRVRGHHYHADLDARYQALWERCMHGRTVDGLTWEQVAIDGLHAIMPDVLDVLWRATAEGATCAGALSVRYNCPSAGTAGLFVVKRGMEDIADVMPGIMSRHAGDMLALNRLVALLRTNDHRWDYSINARYYGAQVGACPMAEAESLAAYVLGVYNTLARSAPLRSAPSLLRLANAHPVLVGIVEAYARGVENKLEEQGVKVLIGGDHPALEAPH